MQYRRNGKLLDTDTAEMLAEFGNAKLYRNSRAEFFLYEQLALDKVKVSHITPGEANRWLRKSSMAVDRDIDHPDFIFEAKDKFVRFTVEKQYTPILQSLSSKKGMTTNEYVKWLTIEKVLKEEEKLQRKNSKKNQ